MTSTRVPHLTDRERFVLAKLAEGYSVTEIQPMLTEPPARGSATGMTTPGKHAAQTAVERLRLKLMARTLAQLVHRAHVHGFLTATDPA